MAKPRENRSDYIAKQQRLRRSEVSDIAPLPEPLHVEERERGRTDLAFFLRFFMPEKFYREFDPDMLHAIKCIEVAINNGGMFAEAMPRGKGKTTAAEGAMLWAASYGHRKFMVLIASDQDKGNNGIGNIQAVVEGQCPRFCEAFPEIAYPVERMEGRNQRAQAQHMAGYPTNMTWKADKIVLPTIDGCDSGGVIIQAKGITSKGIRGMNHSGQRPDFALLDDPQDDESAESEAQTNKREKIVLQTVMGLAGHDKKMSCVMTCTVICRSDLSDRFLDRVKHPEWQGYRTKLVDSWQTDKKKWAEYEAIYREDIQNGIGYGRATEFYRENQAVMDKGSKLSSPELFDPDCEISALQHAHNLLIEVGESGFDSEYQNEPKNQDVSIYDLTPELIMSRENIRDKYQIPDWGKVLIAATDINLYGLHSSMVSFGNDQSSSVVWFGRLDNKGRPLVPKNTPEQQQKTAVYEALVRHGKLIIESGQPLDLWLIDRGYFPDVVHKYINEVGKNLPFDVFAAWGASAERYKPSGKGTIGAPREQCHATEWPIGKGISFNMHYWCEVMQKAWLGSVGAPGSCSLYRNCDSKEFAEHICRQKLIEKFDGKYGVVWKYHQAPGRNDYGDSMYMCYVGAAWLGIGTSGHVEKKQQPKRRRRVRQIAV